MPSRLHYKIYPIANKITQSPPLLILHGLLGSMDNWRSQAKKLSQARTVIIIDLRNHGHSPHIKGMSYKQMGLDIMTILEYEKLLTIDLLGHSMGGKIAMWLALHYPTRITTLIVVDIAPKTYPLWHQKVLTAMLMAPLSEFQSRQQVDHYLSQVISDPLERLFLLKNLERHKENGYQWRCNLKEIAKSYLKIATFPISNLTFLGKSYFIRGENSTYIEPNDHALIRKLFPKAKIHSIANSGHLPHIEEADRFYQLLATFLK